jgi:hypothetical protein
MVKAASARGFRLYPKSILDVFNVFKHLLMLWMGMWVHPYSVMPIQVMGVVF